MGTVAEYRQYLERLKDNITVIAGEAMMEHKEPIVALLVYQQEQEHVDSASNPLREYRQNTKIHKRLEGKSGRTDFDETGYFHATLYLSVYGNQYSINSPALTDKGELKSEWLNAWNGSETMNLTPENEERVFEIIKETFEEKVSNL